MSRDQALRTDSEGSETAARIVRLTRSGPQIEEFYRTVLETSFHLDELCALPNLQTKADEGTADIWLALDEQGRVLAGVVGEWEEELRTVLVAWIAARPGMRGQGIGGPLLDAAVASWAERFDPCVILAEIEDPLHHAADEAHGDPAARLEFYLRHGSRKLDLPYFQPALGSAKQRIDDLFLMLLHAHPSFAGAEPDTLAGPVIREYIEAYQLGCEGAVGTDEQAMRLWEGIDRPGGIRILPGGRVRP